MVTEITHLMSLQSSLVDFIDNYKQRKWQLNFADTFIHYGNS